MVNEEDAIRTFVARQLIQCSDLSSLTLGVLRKRYLEHAGRESLSHKDRQLMKTIVEEELLKMQESSDDEPLVKFVDKKRKRVDDEDDGEEGLMHKEMERTKRSRHEVSSPDSPDSGIVKAMNEEGQKEVEDESDDKNEDDDSEEEKKNTGKKVKQQKKNIRGNKQSKKREVQKKRAKIIDGEVEEESEYSDEENLKTSPAKGKEKREDSGSEEKMRDKQAKNSSSDSASDSEDKKRRGKEKIQKKRKEMKKMTPVEMDAVKEVERQVFGSSSESEEEKTEMTKTGKSSDPESERTGESEEECVANSSIRKEEKETLQDHLGEVEDDSDSSSSSLPSLEDEEEQEKGKKEGKQKSVTKKKRIEERENTARAKDEENKTVARLKRYISLCGVRRNYKKLLDGCRSVKAKVAVLKKELEELGVEGQPSIEKCKKARLKREEAQEVAELDVSNIITTQGRPKRKAAAAVWPPPSNISPPRCVYKHAVDSDSDSEDSHTNRGRKRATAWSNLQGIISDDGESD